MRRVLGAVGRVLITVGLLLLLFVAYQLWGTGIYEARAQNRLEDQFNTQRRQHSPATTTPTATTEPSPTVATTPSTTTLVPTPVPENGDAVARILIPKI